MASATQLGVGTIRKIELIAEGESIDRGWVDDLVDAHGKYVVDP